MDTLYLIEIGGIRDDCLFELHSVHALIARDDADLVAQCRDRFSAMYGAPHIDGWIALDLAADGGDDANPAKAFSCRIGPQQCGQNPQEHDYAFISAADGREALTIARTQRPGWHIDTVLDLDRLARRMGRGLYRADDRGEPIPGLPRAIFGSTGFRHRLLNPSRGGRQFTAMVNAGMKHSRFGRFS
jgi:hypothetical protein